MRDEERLGMVDTRKGPDPRPPLPLPLRKEILMSTTFADAAVMMAEGNIGAMAVLGKLAEECFGRYPLLILTLDDMNIRGEQIYVGFKDVFKGDVQKYIDAVMDRKDELIRGVNSVMFLEHGPGGPKAVKVGGSKRD